MRVVVDMRLCESNGLCAESAPEVFRLGDDDVLVVTEERPDESLRPQVELAVRRCPKQAIHLEEDS